MNTIRIYTFEAKPNYVHDLKIHEHARFLSAYGDRTTLIGGKSEIRVIASFYINTELPEVDRKILCILDDLSMDMYEDHHDVVYLGTAWHAHDGFVTSYFLWELLSGLAPKDEKDQE